MNTKGKDYSGFEDRIEFHYAHFDTNEGMKVKKSILLPQEEDFAKDLLPCFETRHITVDKIDVVFDMENGHDKRFVCEVRMISNGDMFYKSTNEGDKYLETVHFTLNEAVRYVHKMNAKQTDISR